MVPTEKPRPRWFRRFVLMSTLAVFPFLSTGCGGGLLGGIAQMGQRVLGIAGQGIRGLGAVRNLVGAGRALTGGVRGPGFPGGNIANAVRAAAPRNAVPAPTNTRSPTPPRTTGPTAPTAPRTTSGPTAPSVRTGSGPTAPS